MLCVVGRFTLYLPKSMHNSINIKSYSVSLSKEDPRTYIERCALEVFLGLYGSSVVEGGVPNGNAIFIHLRSSQLLR